MKNETQPLPAKLTAVYGSKSKKTIHIGEPGGATLLRVSGGSYGTNDDIVRAMVDAYNEKRLSIPKESTGEARDKPPQPRRHPMPTDLDLRREVADSHQQP